MRAFARLQCPAVPDERLDSWKEIAAYLKRDVATVRRWEKREGLPVHRHLHHKLGSVYAYRSELDSWLEGRRQHVEQPQQPAAPQRAWLVIAAVVAVAVIALAAFLIRSQRPNSANGGRVRIAVHRPGTVASLIAAGLKDALARGAPDVAVDLVQQPGMASTLRALDAGEVDVGLAFNLLAFHAVKTGEVLGRPSPDITALTVAYATPAQLLVRRDSDIKTLSDLRGRRVSLGIAESGERFCSRILLSHMGIGQDDVNDQALDFAPSLEELRAARIDAYLTWRGLPVPDLAAAFPSGALRLIPLDHDSVQGLRIKHPFLVPWTIPARVYAGQDEPVHTVSGRIVLLAAKSLPADLVARLMQVIASHLPDLVVRHPAAADILVTRRPTIEDGLSIELHPGSDRFFAALESR
jgi:TRAP transporter TAXI family solute receptor